MDFTAQFLELRQKCIEKEFAHLNPMQMQAVGAARGPVLILAGAGSGKTTVLVNRIAALVQFGDAYESSTTPFAVGPAEVQALQAYLDGNSPLPLALISQNAPRPWEILAITFTNKAASELKNRIELKLGTNANDIWAGTFHSVCGKILRRFGEYIGYSSHFTIYDTDDQKRAMKEVYRQLDIDEKVLPIRSALSAISSAKDKLQSPEDYRAAAGSDYRMGKIADAYAAYQKLLKNADAMDFDDMIVNTVALLRQSPETLEYYRNRFKYIMVDEYQDTNHAQYVLVSTLAAPRNNICVVGDDDQSIYRFRGATIENILEFEDQYKGAKVIRLEQNYRSTQVILDAANAVIAHNTARKSKALWTAQDGGAKIRLHTAYSEQEEARFVAETIVENVHAGGRYCDHAVLYRMNAQSGALENVLARSGIPYRVIGGHRFFDRKEVKDILAYLHILDNPKDDVRLRRIINEPKRGIGETTLARAAACAEGLGVSMYEIFQSVEDYPSIPAAARQKIAGFVQMVQQLQEQLATTELKDIVELVAEQSGYMDMLRTQGLEGADRMDNVRELASNLARHAEENEEATLAGFLEEIALITDIDAYDSDSDTVILMTLHAAKGLEFHSVFLIGMEEGIFPGNQSIYGGPAEIEEERRLAYVGITRAKKRLYLSKAETRMLFGSTSRNVPSRFAEEVPKDLLEETRSGGFGGWGGFGEYGYGQPRQSGGYQSEYSQYVNVNRDAPARSGWTPVGGQRTGGAYLARQKKPAAKSAAQFSAGQRVSHKAFGEGTVLSAAPMGNDTLLEIAFDQKGTKKLFASFANLKKL